MKTFEPRRRVPFGTLWGHWKILRGPRVAGPEIPQILIKKRQCRARFFKIPTFRSPEWSSKKSLRGSLGKWNSQDFANCLYI